MLDNVSASFINRQITVMHGAFVESGSTRLLNDEITSSRHLIQNAGNPQLTFSSGHKRFRFT